jgi:hypothetical protein
MSDGTEKNSKSCSLWLILGDNDLEAFGVFGVKLANFVAQSAVMIPETVQKICSRRGSTVDTIRLIHPISTQQLM